MAIARLQAGAARQASKVPIVAYHSVADPHDHVFGFLSLEIALFERQLRYLQRNGFQTVTLYDVHAYLRDGAPLPPKAIALTLDDGYLDNWVHAFPLLKRYSMKATIFVPTDFVDPYDGCRPTLDDVWAGRIDQRDLEWWGHLSWPELRTMQASGLVDVQSHTRTHTWYFVGDEIVDFHHPADTYVWLDWNHRRAEKAGWLTRDFRAAAPWGTPIYKFAQTLLEPRYFDDPNVARTATDYVAERGGAAFFSRPSWRTELEQVTTAYRRQASATGRFETDTEYVDRVRDELIGSKQILAAGMNKPVDFLSWPCGDYSARLQRIAIEDCGYLATVNAEKVTNRPGDDPRELRRIVFGQDYVGPWRSDLVFMNFCGNVNYHSGTSLAYPIAPIARRLMRVAKLLH
jgi:peptidoglycan/xylan/chitin deacetylase (PgdA/CDA1 family)